VYVQVRSQRDGQFPLTEFDERFYQRPTQPRGPVHGEQKLRQMLGVPYAHLQGASLSQVCDKIQSYGVSKTVTFRYCGSFAGHFDRMWTKLETLRDFSEHGKLVEFCAISWNNFN